MRASLSAAAAIAVMVAAGPALAFNQTTTQTGDNNTQTSDQARLAGGNSPAKYPGVDSDGKRVMVKAPYGGRSQAQADAAENPVTDKLNQQELAPGQTK